MSTALEIAQKVANLNRISQHMKGLRFHGNSVVSTNLTNTFRATGLPFEGLDCLVDSDTFLAAYKSFKAPVVEQKELLLTVKSATAKSKVDLMLKDTKNYNIELEKAPAGVSIDPQGFLTAIKRLLPFLKIANNQLWALENHLYCADPYFVVRTPADCELPTFDRPITIPLQVSELLQQIDDKPIAVFIDEDALTFQFENCSIESARFNPALAGDYTALFKNGYDEIKFDVLPEEVLEGLKNMVGFADKADTISFGPMGITLMQAGKVSWSVAHPMPNMLFNAGALKTVLAHGTDFCFEDPTRIAFRSRDVEGFWASMSLVKAGEEAVV